MAFLPPLELDGDDDAESLAGFEAGVDSEPEAFPEDFSEDFSVDFPDDSELSLLLPSDGLARESLR